MKRFSKMLALGLAAALVFGMTAQAESVNGGNSDAASEAMKTRQRSISGAYNLGTEKSRRQEDTASDSESLLGTDDAPSTYTVWIILCSTQKVLVFC